MTAIEINPGGEDFIQKSVAAKYRAMDLCLRHVRLTLVFSDSAHPHIAKIHQWAAPGDYYTAGWRLARQFEGFLRRYNRIMSPAEAKQADAEFETLNAKLRWFEAWAGNRTDFDLMFEDMQEPVRDAVDSVPLAKLRRHLRQWLHQNPGAVLYEANVTMQESPQQIKNAATFYAARGKDRKDNDSFGVVWSPRP